MSITWRCACCVAIFDFAIRPAYEVQNLTSGVFSRVCTPCTAGHSSTELAQLIQIDHNRQLNERLTRDPLPAYLLDLIRRAVDETADVASTRRALLDLGAWYRAWSRT